MIALIGLSILGLGFLIAAIWIIWDIYLNYGGAPGTIALLILGGAITALVGHFVFGQM